MTTPPAPRVRAVVVNHDGGELVERCVASLLAADHPADRLDIVVSDNASHDGSPAALRRRFPGITVLDNGTNLGFGAAVNRGLEHPGDPPDHVLLLNPDATMPAGGITALLTTMAADPAVGAVCPRIVFDQDRVVVTLVGAGPIEVSSVAVDGRPADDRAHGAAPAVRLPRSDGPAVWSADGRVELHVPTGDTVELTVRIAGPLAVDAPGEVSVTESADGRHTVTIVHPAAHTLIQNDGTVVARDGTGRNRHYHEALDSHRDDPADDVFAWCGAAVLLRSTYLDSVGTFADEFFLYYEDTDLSWRGRAHNWRHRFRPDVVVPHRHSATTGQGNRVTEVHQHRNRLLMLARNAPLSVVMAGYLGLALTVASTLVGGLARGDLTMARHRGRSLLGAVALLPWALSSRRQLRNPGTRSRRVVAAELTDD